MNTRKYMEERQALDEMGKEGLCNYARILLRCSYQSYSEYRSKEPDFRFQDALDRCIDDSSEEHMEELKDEILVHILG